MVSKNYKDKEFFPITARWAITCKNILEMHSIYVRMLNNYKLLGDNVVINF